MMCACKWPVVKKLTKKAKKKGCEELLPWIPSISNHLWWCAATCDKNAKILRDKWVSLLHHITGKPSWRSSNEFQLIKKCGYSKLSSGDQRSIKWLDSGSWAHVALEEVITNKKLMKDMEKLTEFHHTGELQSYTIPLWQNIFPKREHFCYGMVARTPLAIMDRNANVKRPRDQARVNKVARQGEERCKIVCGKQRKIWVAKEIRTPKNHRHVEGMIHDVIFC